MKPFINWDELQSLRTMQHPPQPIQDPGQFWGKQAAMYNQMAHMEKNIQPTRLTPLVQT